MGPVIVIARVDARTMGTVDRLARESIRARSCWLRVFVEAEVEVVAIGIPSVSLECTRAQVCPFLSPNCHRWICVSISVLRVSDVTGVTEVVNEVAGADPARGFAAPQALTDGELSANLFSVTTSSELRWLPLPDVAELLQVGIGRVHRLIEDRSLAVRRIDGVLQVPELFLRDGEVVTELRGTLIVLADAGFSDDEALDWVLTVNETLGVSPIEALLGGRKAEVRRVAQALA